MVSAYWLALCGFMCIFVASCGQTYTLRHYGDAAISES